MPAATKPTQTNKPMVPQKPIEKLTQLAKTQQFAWFMGHVVVLASGFVYFISFKDYLYRLAYVGVLHSFGVITFQQYFSKQATGKKTISSLLRDDNVLYFALSALWFVIPRFSLSLIPYIIFSVFHTLRYLQNVLLPTVFDLSKDNSKVVNQIGHFTQNYNERCMYWVATVELVTFVIIILRAILFYPRSWILLVFYTLFIKIKYENSKYSKTAFAQWRVRLDGLISHPSVPPAAKQAYNSLKSKLIEISHFQLTSAMPATSTENSKENPKTK